MFNTFLFLVHDYDLYQTFCQRETKVNLKYVICCFFDSNFEFNFSF